MSGKVDEWIKQLGGIDEVRQLYQKLGYRNHRDRDRDPKAAYDPDAEDSKNKLDQIIWDICYFRSEGKVDTASFKDAAYENAAMYLKSPSLYSPWLATFLLTAILDAELVPLSRECSEWGAPWRITSLLPQPWNIIIPSILSSVFFLVAMGIVLFLVSVGWTAVAAIVAAYVLWEYIQRYRENSALLEAKEKQIRLRGALNLIRDEVASGHFDALEIAARLKRWEAEGLYVHSLAYALLRSLTNGNL